MSKFIYKTMLFALLTLQSAQADIIVSFIEGAPKDRFIIKNTGECEFANLNVEIDLSSSAGKLIFDTTANGAGVEVFQPFETGKGKLQLLSANQVNDGEQALSVSIQKLSPDTSVSFTIDVDDTLPISELGKIRVSGSEIANGQVNVNYADQPESSGLFNARSVAVIPAPKCEAK